MNPKDDGWCNDEHLRKQVWDVAVFIFSVHFHGVKAVLNLKRRLAMQTLRLMLWSPHARILDLDKNNHQ